MANLTWVKTDSTVHFTSAEGATPTSENESIAFGPFANPSYLESGACLSGRHFTLKSLAVSVNDAAGGTMSQALDFLFYATSAGIQTTDVTTDEFLGQIAVSASAWEDSGNGLFYWEDHDINLPLVDKESWNTASLRSNGSPRIHVRMKVASGDLAADDTITVRFGLQPYPPDLF